MEKGNILENVLFFPNEKAFGKLLANPFLPDTIDISAQPQHKANVPQSLPGLTALVE
jgi:hypothetical protein